MMLGQVLKEYDNREKKHFYDFDFRASLSQVSDEDKQTLAFKFEMLAFSLVGNGQNNDWGTYYGPTFIGKNEDGTPAYLPPIENITNEAVLYWESRINQTDNPLLKMQYAGLVWDFKKKVCTEHYPANLRDNYVCAMIDVINGDYEPHDVVTVNIIERLVSFASKDEKYRDQIKSVLLRFDNERTTEDSSARLWGAYINVITDHKNWFSSDEEKVCINKHEERLLRLSSPNNKNPWATKEQVTALSDYYASRGKKDDLRRVLLVMEQSFRNNKDDMQELQWMGILEQIANIYAKYKLVEERNRLTKEIEDAGKNALMGMNAHSIPFEIPKEAFEHLDAILANGPIDLQFEKFCLYFIPNKENESDQLKKLADKYPLVYMMPTQLMGQHGKPASVIGSIDKDFDGQLVLHMCKTIHINSVFLHYAINKLKETGALSIDEIMKRVSHTPIIDSNRQEIIRQSLLAYDSNQYITMCHLLVPQIEDAFRTLIDKSGKAVIKPQKDINNPGFTQRILDDILRDSIIADTFGDDFAYYSRILLTDQRGLNIRNNLCHGLVEPAFFNNVIADRLFHLLCILTLVRYND